MKLDQFLKWKNLVSSGGEAKIFIKSGSVKVNGVIETRRGRKLNKGDKVIFLNRIKNIKVINPGCNYPIPVNIEAKEFVGTNQFPGQRPAYIKTHRLPPRKIQNAHNQ